MANKKKYFVHVDAKEIYETSIQERIEYEVFATPNEIKEIEELFTKMKKDDINALKYLFSPFDEQAVDNKRHNYDEHLMAVYQLIYKLGTAETKSDINEIGFFN